MDANTPTSEPSDLPRAIGQPAWRALTGAGYWRLEQLPAVRAADLRKLHGVGPKAIDVLRTALAAQGLTFADEP
jgi:predicted flap endonuclease-1-like 5' DNA nuclease